MVIIQFLFRVDLMMEEEKDIKQQQKASQATTHHVLYCTVLPVAWHSTVPVGFAPKAVFSGPKASHTPTLEYMYL
jgi:hypothetical protein